MTFNSNQEPRLFIHGHSCCEIRFRDSALLCDPWLIGSSYWRSWWNFPPQSCLNSLIEEWSQLNSFFVYVTHLHWDHFHGPTLKRIAEKCHNVHFLLPLTPEQRLCKDLRSVVKKRPVTELIHGRSYQLANWLRVLSFQSGPFFADSALYMDVDGIDILNVNDSKLGSLAVDNLLGRIRRPKFVLRSHSSANYRACRRKLDGTGYSTQPDKSKEVYSSEFHEFCSKVGASYAIPFASNMAYLHKDTFKYNEGINSSDMTVSYCQDKYPNSKTIPLLLLPGESVSLGSCVVSKSEHNRLLLEKDRIEVLQAYALSKATCLEHQYLEESSATLNRRLVEQYFTKVISACPVFLKWYLNNHIYFQINSDSSSCFCRIDFMARKVHFFEETPTYRPRDVCFVVHPYVLNDICLHRHFNSLGVSKRLEILVSESNSRDVVFNYLCNTWESEGALSMRVFFGLRFWAVWLRRWPEILDMIAIFVRLSFAALLNSKRIR